jgi:hypothetical protein
MSVSADTYIVIALMFAVFAAVAAVGTSVVLGAGFERLRAGFDLVKRQSGFFADAIYKLDQRTEKLGEETAKLKAGITGMGERVDRVEKTATFMADAINSIEQRILQGSPAQAAPQPKSVRLQPVAMAHTPKVQVEQSWAQKPAREQINTTIASSGLFRDFPEEAPRSADYNDFPEDVLEEPQESSRGLTTLLSRYFTGETSGSEKGVVYH